MKMHTPSADDVKLLSPHNTHAAFGGGDCGGDCGPGGSPCDGDCNG